ncbi:uroporphyrinogen decarboxylase family protein [Oceanispirochaeta sp.]|uniref:uroporphyrinogen decarboxylase family protein n=1 Tax=Oceanispirochaeta sp. TaxID=2035350 RepID=UPI002639459C|nr:uroporphyrinogen decarboxylase family protein [Oceanispirochaeta sp.]MDA3957368.1 methyltransferase [Oceanispirochaeta sp.]
MTSRERVQTALHHKQPDRVPIDLGATPSSGISAIAHARLMVHMKSNDPTLVYDVVQQLAQPGNALIDRLGVDILDIGRQFNDFPEEWREFQMTDKYKAYYPGWFKPVLNERGVWTNTHKDGTVIAVKPAGATFYDQAFFPWVDGYPDSRKGMEEALDEAMDRVLWSNMVHSPWDHAADDGFWDTLRARTITLREESDKALLVVCGSNLFEWGTFLRRMDNFLMDLYIDKDNVAILMELLMERHMKTLEKVCDSVGDLVDVLRFGDDLGMDSGPFMGLDVYTELFHSHRKKLCSFVHENSSMKTFLHSCGSIYQFLPSLIDEGMDIINPLQTNCLNMEPERVKAEFGQDICFWGGGMDPREILNKGTPERVRAEVFRRLDILTPGGGYVFNNIHNIMPDVPPENILSLFDAVQEYSRK